MMYREVYPGLIVLAFAAALSSCIMAPAIGGADASPPIELQRGTRTELALGKRIVWQEGATVSVRSVGDVRLVKVGSDGAIEFSRGEGGWSTSEKLINFGNNVLFVVESLDAQARRVAGYFVQRGRPIM